MPQGSSVYLSVILPAYNKEPVIENALAKSAEFLRTRTYQWEIIVVDDASTDATIARIQRFLEENPGLNIRLLRHERNRQKGAALRTGISEAAGRYALFLDADYAYPISQVEDFLKSLENGASLVIGDRTDPRTTYLIKPLWFPSIYLRYLLGRTFNLLVRLLLHIGIKDTQCGIKAVRTETARALMAKMTIFNFAYDVEFLFIARQNGVKIDQIPVTYDFIDEPSSVRVLHHSLVMFQGLLQIRLNGWMKKYRLSQARQN
jgi:dolichyl-phosphate beta-glucosyltransferase